MSAPRIIVIAGVSSGVGKTTVTIGLLEALRRRGLVVQGFKVGPDFIDPAFHALVTGRPSYNLDGWMCSRDRVVDTVRRQTNDVDVAVVEGMMGCFDGHEGKSDAGSTAQIAKWLGAPVVLVVDAGALARSAGAIVLGFERYDPALDLAAVIFNRVGGETHARWLHEALDGGCAAEPIGFLETDRMLTLPERHLGLVTAAEGPLDQTLREALARTVEASVDLDRLLALARPLALPTMPAGLPASDVPRELSALHHAGASLETAGAGHARRARIGVARDLAFQFYYQENLERLEAAGAELVFWSPLRDASAPDTDGLYFGGGYPELHAAALAANAVVREQVRLFAGAGRPIYAECGGLMYLAETLQDLEGARHEMVGILPAAVTMQPRTLTLAYTEVELTTASPLGSAGMLARGHEFHYSTLSPVPDAVPRVYRIRRSHTSELATEGYLVGQTLMSYVHLHFASAPELADAFVAACASR